MTDSTHTDALHDLGTRIERAMHDEIRGFEIAHGELTVRAAVAHIATVIQYLQSNSACQFTTLIDITAVDYPAREKRFELVYHLLSMQKNHRIRVKCAVREDQLVPSILPVFPSANWFEREVYDMYGIMFSDHPDLRRLLTDYGFQGHPLRKDFPTTGYVEMRYDEVQKRCIYEPVQLVQEYRQFDFMSPWEGAQYVLPGDEKEAQS